VADKHAEDTHEWDVDVLERTLKTSTARFAIATVVAVPALIAGIVGIASGGSGPIWGLAALLLGAVASSFALRSKTKRDYCRRQLERITRGEGPTPKKSTQESR
jgi:hypothetical protein